MTYKIPFNRPCFVGHELAYISQAIANGHVSGDGLFTLKCHAFLEQQLNVPKVLLTSSCTHALEMAALLLNIQPDDEVIIPSFTFVSTVNAFVMRRAYPRFIDIRPDTLNLDETQLEQLISSRTKAIVPVHYAGVGCEMAAIMEIAQDYGLSVVEDNAHGLFGRYRGKFLGTFGTMATLSFHETKNFICGEGGALLLNDPKFIERAEIIREKGTDRSRFFRGEVDKYTWVDIGSSYLPSDILAAFLWAQFEARDQIQQKRKKVWEYYWQNLQDWAQAQGVRLPTVPANCDHNYHMFYMIMPSFSARQALMGHLKKYGILSVFHYLPLHLSTMGQKFGGQPGDCPVTENLSERLLRLPFYNDFSEQDQQLIVSLINDFTIP